MVVNKETLRTVLEALEEKDLSGYTEESVNRLNEAKEAAQAVLNNEEADQEDVDAAVKALNDAVQGLVEKPAPTPDPEPVQKESLTKLVEEITVIDTSSYTEESVPALQAAVPNAPFHGSVHL